jgi:NAD-dependent dihydropyrimidine dehydrogenase PreA subunit
MELRYFANGRSLRLDAGACVACGRCIEVCPHAVFSLAGGPAMISRRDRCMECGACMRNCPTSAISVDAGVGCTAAIITGILRKKAPSCDCGGGPACCG